MVAIWKELSQVILVIFAAYKSTLKLKETWKYYFTKIEKLFRDTYEP